MKPNSSHQVIDEKRGRAFNGYLRQEFSILIYNQVTNEKIEVIWLIASNKRRLGKRPKSWAAKP